MHLAAVGVGHGIATARAIIQALVDRPDETRRMMNFKRLALTPYKVEIPRLAKKKVLKAALEESGALLPLLPAVGLVAGQQGNLQRRGRLAVRQRSRLWGLFQLAVRCSAGACKDSSAAMRLQLRHRCTAGSILSQCRAFGCFCDQGCYRLAGMRGNCRQEVCCGEAWYHCS